MSKKIQKPKSKNQNPKISPARLAAFEILLKIERERAFSSVLLPIYEEKLALADRALCHEITLGVLRKQIYLDRIIQEFAGNKKLDREIKIILRIGLYQLLFLDKIPDYSAINESVNLAQTAKKTSAKGFINAILRRATREKPELRFADEMERVSVENSHPRWLVEKWASDFGAEDAEKLAAENNRLPRIAFRFTRKFEEADENIKKEISAKINEKYAKSVYVENCFLAEKFDADLLDLAGKDFIYFQDEGSQMVGQTVKLKPGERFLDVCAAPGSKTTQIAEKNPTNENLIVGGDVHFQRVEFLKENCRRQAVDFANVLQYDAEKALPFADESFDSVLLDAPCSGTGTINHNPEIRYFLEQNDFTELSGKQLKILENASKLIRQGGKLIYSTCSLEKEENEAVCARFAANNPHFRLIENDRIDKFATEEGFTRTFPQRDKMDGFFIAVFERK